MADSWEQSKSSAQPTQPREYLVSLEVYVSNTSATAFRKPPTSSRKKPEKRDSLKPPTGFVEDNKRIKEKSSWITLSRTTAGQDHWRAATCRLAEEGERCLLNVYLDETILYQTIFIHLLHQTDIRIVDPSLFLRKECVGIYCAENQRWSSGTSSIEPVYLHFGNTDACNTWLALLRSYAIPEIYGRDVSIEGGSYRMWRQVELTIMQGRNLGNTKPFMELFAKQTAGSTDPYVEPDAVDLDVYCEIHLNEFLCGRSTTKKGIGSPDWHENFTFADVPPFDILEVAVWREKRLFKPIMMGSVRIALSNFRRGEAIEGWFPVLHSGPLGADLIVGEIRLKLRVDEEIILPYTAYIGLLQVYNSRNFLDWMTEFETKLDLKTISTPLMSIAVARNSLIEQVFELADREVDGTPSSHHTLFRGNTILTKIMELCMAWYGRTFLELSIGSVLRRLCAEKVAIEVDPIRSGKSIKELEKNVEQLIYWCQEFWKQIYSVRAECPHDFSEMRRLFEHVRMLVEKRYQIDGTGQEQNRDLPWQSVSAFCFLRFIVPAILHPHLFGLCSGLPTVPVQRSLTLIAKVIQSLANLNVTVQKEEFMRGVQDFLRDSSQAMIDYILVISTPTIEPQSTTYSPDMYDRLNVINSLRQRSAALPILDREAIPILPHLLDIPKHLAMISSSVIRHSRGLRNKRKAQEPMTKSLEEFCTKCFEVEEHALHRVSQLAARYSTERRRDHPRHIHTQAMQPRSTTSPPRSVHPSPANSIRTTRKSTGLTIVPSTSRSSASRSRDQRPAGESSSSLNGYSKSGSHSRDSLVLTATAEGDLSESSATSTIPEILHPHVLSTEPVLSKTTPDTTPFTISRQSIKDPPAETSEESAIKKKKGLLRGILTRR